MKPSPKVERQKDFCYTHYLTPESDIHPVFVRFDYNSGREEYDYGLHRHVDHELVYVEHGQYSAQLNRRQVQIPSGGLLLICPGDEHRDHARAGLKYYTLSFFIRSALGKGHEIPLLQQGLPHDKKIFAADNKLIEASIHESAKMMRQITHGSAHLAHALLLEIFWRFVLKIPANLYSTEFFRLSIPDNFARKFYQIIEEAPPELLNLHRIANKLSVSPSQLNKLCNKHLKHSPGQLVQQFRINQACELLAKSNLTIREISEVLGFKDQFTLSRSFKLKKGMPPLEYRKIQQGDADMEVRGFQ